MNNVALATLIDKNNKKYEIVLDHSFYYSKEITGLASCVEVIDVFGGYSISPENEDDIPTVILTRNNCNIKSRFKNTVYK